MPQIGKFDIYDELSEHAARKDITEYIREKDLVEEKVNMMKNSIHSLTRMSKWKRLDLLDKRMARVMETVFSETWEGIK